MNSVRQPHGFTIVELAVVIVVIVILVTTAVPVIAGAGGNAGVQQSMTNLVAQSAAHLLYAADWNGRQVTHNPDDLGVYGGDVGLYNQAHGCTGVFDPNCHPPIIAGLGPTQGGSWVIWAYWPTTGNNAFLQPMNFPGPPNESAGCDGFGHFRFPQTRPIHDYLNGRYQDPVFFAPNDTSVVGPIEDCFGDPAEFVPFPTECNPAWSSYARSPAAIFHPDVMRSNAAGGWQHTCELDYGFQSPGLFQAQYPDLKTHMIEHHWVQNPPAECNPNFDPPFGTYEGCEPYYFNHGIDSTPVTLFYDGHVRLLPNTEVYAADQQILKQTGGVDGLWHRGTPFGEDGYYISYGYDGAPLSHPILTTDGILGRDTLGGMPSMPVDWQRQWAPKKRRPPTAADRPDVSHSFTLTLDEED